MLLLYVFKEKILLAYSITHAIFTLAEDAIVVTAPFQGTYETQPAATEAMGANGADLSSTCCVVISVSLMWKTWWPPNQKRIKALPAALAPA